MLVIWRSISINVKTCDLLVTNIIESIDYLIDFYHLKKESGVDLFAHTDITWIYLSNCKYRYERIVKNE